MASLSLEEKEADEEEKWEEEEEGGTDAWAYMAEIISPFPLDSVTDGIL